jgi:hypothetical protein
MVVVAGPPGSGKSTVFPVAGFGDHFNADDRAAELIEATSELSHIRERGENC